MAYSTCGQGPGHSSWPQRFCTLTGCTQAGITHVCAMAPGRADRRLAWPLGPGLCRQGPPLTFTTMAHSSSRSGGLHPLCSHSLCVEPMEAQGLRRSISPARCGLLEEEGPCLLCPHLTWGELPGRQTAGHMVLLSSAVATFMLIAHGDPSAHFPQ